MMTSQLPVSFGSQTRPTADGPKGRHSIFRFCCSQLPRWRHLLPGMLAVATWLAPAPTFGQRGSDRPARIGEVLLTAGYGPAVLNWPTFNEFLASYSVVNGATMRTTPKLEMGRTQTLGLVAAGCAYLGYQRTSAHTVAEFTNGSKRNFGVTQGLAIIGVEPRFFIGQRVFLGPTLGLCFGELRVATSYRYPDGTESWGKDRNLNGQYAGTLFTSTFGAKAGVNLGPVLVQVKGDYMLKATGTSGLGDIAGIGDNGMLPRHYDQFLKSTGTFNDPYSLIKDAVMDDFGLMRVSLELALRLNRAD